MNGCKVVMTSRNKRHRGWYPRGGRLPDNDRRRWSITEIPASITRLPRFILFNRPGREIHKTQPFGRAKIAA